jgi:hypothetical protein
VATVASERLDLPSVGDSQDKRAFRLLGQTNHFIDTLEQNRHQLGGGMSGRTHQDEHSDSSLSQRFSLRFFSATSWHLV